MTTESREALLRVKGLSAGYRNVPVLKDINIDVAEGEILAVLGANGAGKSTLLRAICGSVDRYAGAVELDGRQLPDRPSGTVRAGIAHVPEGRRVFPEMTVLENLAVGGVVRPRQMSQRRTEVLELFPKLAERSNQLAGMMSGGEQQLLAIARGLMSQPRILLVDEPSLGLAPMTAEIVFRLLGDLNRAGLTIVLVEQRIESSLEMAHRGYVLEQGSIAMEGSAKELLGDEEVVARYMGVSSAEHAQ